MVKIALMGDLHYPVLGEENMALIEARDSFMTDYFQAFLQTDADFHWRFDAYGVQ